MSTPGRIGPMRTARLAAVGLACVLHSGWTLGEPSVANPLGSGDSIALEPVPPQASPRRQRAVFVCHEGNVPVFADRPCGPAATPRALVVETPQAGAPATIIPPAPRASTRPRAVQGEDRDAPDRVAGSRCATLQRQLDDINDRMRTGYSAREAARLWHRLREVKERLRVSRC